MDFLYDGINMLGPGQIFRHMHAYELKVIYSLLLRPINENKFVDFRPSSFKVLGFTDIESKIVVLAPFNQTIALPIIL